MLNIILIVVPFLACVLQTDIFRQALITYLNYVSDNVIFSDTVVAELLAQEGNVSYIRISN
jgi:hypothetical protein